MTIIRVAIAICITAAVSSPVQAQQPAGGTTAAGPAAAQPAVADAAATLRGKDVLSDQDKAQLRQWITEKIASLEDAAKKNDAKAMVRIKRDMTDAAASGGASPATPTFRIAFAEAGSALFQPYLGIGEDARGNDARVALYLAQVLAALKQPGTLDTLLAALNSKYPAVRLCAAKAIRDMRGDIVATRANQLDRIITQIQQAGAKEGDAPTARALYEAVDFRAAAPATTNRVIGAMLEILSGRVQFYDNELVSDFYPDAYALNVLQGVDLPDAEKRRAIPIVVAIVDRAAERWQSVAREEEGVAVAAENPYDALSVRDWHLRYQLAYVTEEAEALLKKLAPAGAQTPDVASLMRNVSTAEPVRAAADQWRSLLAQGPATAPAGQATATP